MAKSAKGKFNTDSKLADIKDIQKRMKAIQDAVNKDVTSDTGDDVVMMYNQNQLAAVPMFSSGCLALDRALGGGYPWGRIIEIYGPESGGKTTLMIHAIASYQKSDPEAIVGFIDAEHSLDVKYAKNLGVDLDRILISQPDSGEQALNIARNLIKHGVRLIVIDSVAALTPKAIIEGEIGDATIGMQARLMSQNIPILNTMLKNHKASILFTNQIRSSIGGMGGNVTSGGRALRFYASQRIDVKRVGSNTQGDDVVSNNVIAKVAKNKVAAPFTKAEFKIVFGKGIDLVEQLIDIGLEMDIIKKGGAWFTFQEQRFQGRANLAEAIENNEKLKEPLFKQVKDAMNGIDIVEQSTHISEFEEASKKEVTKELEDNVQEI